MKQIKSLVNKITFLAGVLYCNFALAGAEDPFAKTTEKTEELITYMTGTFAVAIGTLIIVIAGFAWMMGKLRQEWALRIIGGAALIASAGAVAAWIFS